MSCVRMTRVPFSSREMGRLRAASVRSTLTFVVVFVTDRINKNELSVEWCPTGNMIGDHATKPLQGPVFKKFRDHIVGVMPTPVEEPESEKSKSNGDKTRRPEKQANVW